MKAKPVLFLAVVGVLMSVIGCSAAAGQTPGGTEPPEEKQVKITGVEVSYEELAASKDIAKNIYVTYPGLLQVTLYSNPTTGYKWSEAASIVATDVLHQESHEYVPAPSYGGTVGAGGKEVWTFKTIKQGKTTLSMEYSRPWEGGEKGTWTFELAVTIQ